MALVSSILKEEAAWNCDDFWEPGSTAVANWLSSIGCFRLIFRGETPPLPRVKRQRALQIPPGPNPDHPQKWLRKNRLKKANLAVSNRCLPLDIPKRSACFQGWVCNGTSTIETFFNVKKRLITLNNVSFRFFPFRPWSFLSQI